MDLNKFREQYPEYAKYDDETLGKAIYAKYYGPGTKNEMPEETFWQKVKGVASEARDIVQNFGESVGRATQPVIDKVGRVAAGYGDAAATMASGIVAAPLAGAAKIAGTMIESATTPMLNPKDVRTWSKEQVAQYMKDRAEKAAGYGRAAEQEALNMYQYEPRYPETANALEIMNKRSPDMQLFNRGLGVIEKGATNLLGEDMGGVVGGAAMIAPMFIGGKKGRSIIEHVKDPLNEGRFYPEVGNRGSFSKKPTGGDVININKAKSKVEKEQRVKDEAVYNDQLTKLKSLEDQIAEERSKKLYTAMGKNFDDIDVARDYVDAAWDNGKFDSEEAYINTLMKLEEQVPKEKPPLELASSTKEPMPTEKISYVSDEGAISQGEKKFDYQATVKEPMKKIGRTSAEIVADLEKDGLPIPLSAKKDIDFYNRGMLTEEELVERLRPSNEPLKALSKEELDYIHDGYIADSQGVNDNLRFGIDSSKHPPYVRKTIEAMDKAFELTKPIDKSTIVYRAVPKDSDFLKGAKVGDIITDKAYASSSKSLSTHKRVIDDAMYYAGIDHGTVEIVVPKGTKLLDLSDPKFNNYFDYQGEVVLPRGSKFKVLSKTKDKTVLEVIPDKLSLVPKDGTLVTELPDTGPVKPGERGSIKVYHGTVHDYDKPDLSKIGTGEGAQAFGWGLYYTTHENVAKAYAKNIAKVKDQVKPKNITLSIGGSTLTGKQLTGLGSLPMNLHRAALRGDTIKKQQKIVTKAINNISKIIPDETEYSNLLSEDKFYRAPKDPLSIKEYDNPRTIHDAWGFRYDDEKSLVLQEKYKSDYADHDMFHTFEHWIKDKDNHRLHTQVARYKGVDVNVENTAWSVKDKPGTGTMRLEIDFNSQLPGLNRKSVVLYYGDPRSVPESVINRYNELITNKGYKQEIDKMIATYDKKINRAKEQVEMLKNTPIDKIILDMGKVEPSKQILYEVTLHKDKLPSEYDYIDRQKPLTNRQINKISSGIDKAPEELRNKFYEQFELEPSMTGAGVYHDLVEILGSPKNASLWLKSIGIDGLTYIGRESGRRNFIVFDPEAVYHETKKILNPKPGQRGSISNKPLEVKFNEFEPELRSLVESYIKVKQKVNYSYSDYGRAIRNHTPQQDAAITRAGNKLFRKYRELHPEDEQALGYIKLLEKIQGYDTEYPKPGQRGSVSNKSLKGKDRWTSPTNEMIKIQKEDKMPPAEWLKRINAWGDKHPSIKDENKWSGVEDYIKSRLGDKTINKQDIVDFYELSKSKWAERKQTHGNPGTHKDTPGDEWYWTYDQDPWAGYNIPGGIEGTEKVYVLQVPGETKLGLNKELDKLNTELQDKYGKNTYDWPDDEFNKYRDLRDKFEMKSDKNDYASPHFPNNPNVVIHFRTQERLDSQGKKGLMVETIQSDWHQQANGKYGTVIPLNEAEMAERNKLAVMEYGERSKKGLQERYEELLRRSQYYAEYDGRSLSLPPAPFEKSWPEVALKHALDIAAKDKSIKWVGWPSGKVQNERWGKNGKFLDPANHPRYADFYEEAFNYLVDEHKKENGKPPKGAVLDELEEVATEMAMDKVMNEPIEKESTGTFLETLYDKRLTKFAAKYSEKLGGKYRKDALYPHSSKFQADAYDIHRIDLTPELKTKINTKGQSFYKIPLAIGAATGVNALSQGSEK